MTEGDEGADQGPVEYDPRVRIFDSNTGETRPVEKDKVVGLDSFIDNWKSDTELPDEMSFGGWQMVDDDHPAGTGAPGYRLVHKTLRSVPLPRVDASIANLRLEFANGPVTFGGPIFHRTLPGRKAGSYLLPEWGKLHVEDTSNIRYEFNPNYQINIEAHQATTPDGNYVEILYRLPEGTSDRYDEMVGAGRAGVAPLTAVLDLLYGERLLGPIIAEEVGEVFEDWHWNRLLGGRTVAIESQARLEQVDGNSFLGKLRSIIEEWGNRSDESRARLRIASQWYWRADAEPEQVQRYIAYWLCIEALELGENQNILPVKAAAAKLLGVQRRDVADRVGRIYNIRNRLVHGVMREVDAESVSRVRALALALLEYHSLGGASERRLLDLRVALGVEEAS